MEYTDTPTIFLDAEVELAIRRAIRNEKRRSQNAKKAKVNTKKRRAPKLEKIMNDPAILNA
jgi:hypothetical protein